MRARLLFIVSLATVAALLPLPSSAHQSLRQGNYECWLSQIAQYSNYDLQIKAGGGYVFKLHDGSWKKSGKYVHDGEHVRFTGYLKKKGFKGKHAALDDAYDTHMIYLYKGGYDLDNLKYDCNNN